VRRTRRDERRRLRLCSPVCEDYPAGRAYAFDGTIEFIRIELGEDSHDHLIDPEIKAQLALSRQ